MAKRHIVRVFRVKMSEGMAKELEELVNEGYYVTYADAIRHALDIYLGRELDLKKIKYLRPVKEK
jgi:Arc/MetJ-type ribon-helix-helix transcriptional regulator